jgi:hypothetical protein
MQMTVRYFLTTLLLASLAMQIGCGGDSDKRKNSVINPQSYRGVDTAELVDDLYDLDQAISLGQVLSSNPRRSLPLITSAIENARIGVQTLSLQNVTEQQEKDAFTRFTTAIGQYEKYGILDFEQDRFERVFNRVRELRSLLIREGVEDSGWVIYNNNFADGIEPEFKGFAVRGSDTWVTNFQIDLPKARVQARSGKAWLISKPFDIKNIERPSFRYFTSYLIVAPNPILSLPEVIQEVFGTYIILDLQPDEDVEKIPADRKIKVKYDNNDLPLGRDFHDAWVPLVSLEKYKNNKVSIGFLFNTTDLEEQQYHGWTIFDFELHGFGVLKREPVKTVSRVEDFKSFSLDFGGEIWKPQTDKDGVSASAGTERTDAFLVSPIFTTPPSAVDPKLLINESLSGADLEFAELWISENYKGGKSPVAEDVVWEVLDKRAETFEGRDFAYDLNKYKGKSFVLGFRFKSEANRDVKWSVNSILFESKIANVISSNYSAPDLDEKFVVSESLGSDLDSFQAIYEAENSPKWGNDRKGPGIFITGFVNDGDNMTGLSRLILNEADLTGVKNARVRLLHSMKHFKGAGALEVQVRLTCKGQPDPCENLWSNIEFPEGTFQQFIDNPTLTSWVLLPDNLQGQKLEFSLVYKAEPRNTPQWVIDKLQVGGLK